MSFGFHPKRKPNLTPIWLHIARQCGSIDTANRIIDNITARFWLLARHPYMGRQREDLGSGVRSFPTGDYVIVHRNDSEDGAVLISFVFHGSQDIESFFFIRKPFKTPTPPSINK
jgi:toxin ParE1/3/4